MKNKEQTGMPLRRRVLKSMLLLLFSSTFLSAQSGDTKILFLTLKIEKNKQTQIENVSVVNKFLVDGHLKKNVNTKSIEFKSLLLLSFLNESDKVINQIEIENPLKGNFESFNLDGTMQRHTVDLSQAEFIVRINYAEAMKMLRISKGNGQKQVQVISTIDIKL
jgi:hypothetical protein